MPNVFALIFNSQFARKRNFGKLPFRFEGRLMVFDASAKMMSAIDRPRRFGINLPIANVNLTHDFLLGCVLERSIGLLLVWFAP